MDAAAIALSEAADAEEQEQKQQRETARLKGEPEPQFDPVNLRLRSVPFLEMMKRCTQADVGIVWGV
jgi:hypothetical protein